MQIGIVNEPTFRLPPGAAQLLDWFINAHPSEVKELLKSNVDIVVSGDLNKDSCCKDALVNIVIQALALLEHVE